MNDGFGIFVLMLMIVIMTSFFVTDCAETNFRQHIIQEKQFCIEATSSGVAFKKCYDVKEKE